MSETTKKVRLDRYLSEQTCRSRNEVKEFIKRRVVTVNGVTAKLFDMKITPGTDAVSVDGKPIEYRRHVYIMLNKPAGVVCAVRDALSETVIELIPENLRRKGLFPAGRLDKDTEGFAFITDDGALAHRMLSPKNHVEKLYYAELSAPLDESAIGLFASGMTIDGGEKCLPAKLEFPVPDDRSKVHITLHEGKFHQVKRMVHAAGSEVVYLRRIRIGNVHLDENLPLGEAREMLHKEVENIIAD